VIAVARELTGLGLVVGGGACAVVWALWWGLPRWARHRVELERYRAWRGAYVEYLATKVSQDPMWGITDAPLTHELHVYDQGREP
jgi:hypothetical protein